ncbi:retrotransposon hot spot (RHS) protein [Trypanosoma grayi]|uniref:retrotransposon hot spot (RHS) protein n=1 Tax=Trypanosoma grayi TaxID=71804 RepID=UPI0004F491F7|nr:retrotransposon hot spot (RHS) protein [Trypanosoma grayi]KEG14520.1 retrotransposon hot spot (RHS) protein [Trypanosoma grayi]
MPPKKKNARRSTPVGDTVAKQRKKPPRLCGRARPRTDSVINDTQPPASHAGTETVNEPKWSFNSTVEEVLLKGNVRQTNLMLNDFLREHLRGRGVEKANENVSMEAFAIRPKRYIEDEELIKDIRAMPLFIAIMDEMSRTEEEMMMREVVDELNESGVYSLRQWNVYTAKDQVILPARTILNTAFRVAKNFFPVLKGELMAGVYESVFNATWNHVVEVPGGRGIGMEVREGRPSREWSDNEVDYAPPGGANENAENDNGGTLMDPHEPCLQLMVLNSAKGWPYEFCRANSKNDCYIGRETERVWRIIKHDLDKWFESCCGDAVGPEKRILIGTPGIGKSMGAGSYLLYQLLHYDKQRLPVVAYFIARKMYLFDKTGGEEEGRVECYESIEEGENAVVRLSTNLGGYIIYDVMSRHEKPSVNLPPDGWGMIVVTSPDEDTFMEWEEQRRGRRNVMNCSSINELKAMCVWINRNELDEEQQKEWSIVEERINKVGPNLRPIFSRSTYDEYAQEIEDALFRITRSFDSVFAGANDYDIWRFSSPCEVLGKAVRHPTGDIFDDYFNEPMSLAIEEALRTRPRYGRNPHCKMM